MAYDNNTLMFDPRTNISYGIEYLQPLQRQAIFESKVNPATQKVPIIAETYESYRGKDVEPEYYPKLHKCMQGLLDNPGSTKPLKDMKGEKF